MPQQAGHSSDPDQENDRAAGKDPANEAQK
jgi:hypothetical protein